MMMNIKRLLYCISGLINLQIIVFKHLSLEYCTILVFILFILFL